MRSFAPGKTVATGLSLPLSVCMSVPLSVSVCTYDNSSASATGSDSTTVLSTPGLGALPHLSTSVTTTLTEGKRKGSEQDIDTLVY